MINMICLHIFQNFKDDVYFIPKKEEIKVCKKKLILESPECYMIGFYYDILHKFSLVLFLAKFNESLKDVHLNVYFKIYLYINEIHNHMKNT